MNEKVGSKGHAVIFTGEGRSSAIVRMSGAKKIANVCEQHGWKVDVVDYFYDWSEHNLDALCQKLISRNTKWVGISYTFLSTEPERVQKFLLKLQLYKNDLIIIMGGNSNFRDAYFPADWFVSGYAEEAIVKILDYEFGNGVVPMHSKLHDGRYIDATKNYTSAAAPSYSVYYNDSDFLTPNDVLTIEFSRGCRFKCAYCTYPFLGIKEDTTALEENIYAELNENYQKWGIKHYIIADDTLNDRTSKLIAIKNVVNKLSFKPVFSAYVRADLFKSHPEHYELLAECNIQGQYYGIETFNHKAGASIGKGLHPDIVKDLLLKGREYFMKNMDYYRGNNSFIIGLPYETEEDIFETVRWNNEYWHDQATMMFTLMISTTGSYVSAFGQDLSKFGYEQLPGVQTIGQALDKKLINWKSPWMDSNQALDIRYRAINALTNRYYFSSFAFVNYLSLLGLKIVKKLDGKQQSLLQERYLERRVDLVGRYIRKKLGIE